jgi:arylsulfatase
MKLHADNFANPKYEGLSASKFAYEDCLCESDLLIGSIVKALDEAGVLESTFMFVTCDKGPRLDTWPDAGYTPFRGAKGTTYEGGIRVPGIAYRKGMISPGRVSDDVLDLMDLFNTAIRLVDSASRLFQTPKSTGSTVPFFAARRRKVESPVCVLLVEE